MLTLLATQVLAQDGPQQTGPDFGKASPFGLIVIVLLLIAVFLLVWSMNRHLKKLPTSFDQQDADPDITGPRATDNPADPGTTREPGPGT